MSTRTDIHRPSAPEFDPQAYDFFGCFDLDPEEGDNRDRMQVVNGLIAQGWSFAGAPHGSGRCDHCGAYLRYCALMGHEATRCLIYVGETCLDNRFELTKGEFDRLRKAARLNRERATKNERIEAMCRDWHPFAADLTYPQITDAMGSFVSDLGWKFRQYGELSELQAEAVVKVFEKHFEREAERAARAARDAEHPVCDAPEGKVQVVGEVLTMREQPNPYAYNSYVWKMLVWDDRGFKVWVTVPTALLGIGVDRGSRVQFNATLERSNDDAAFAFGKRPTKAAVLAAPVAPAARPSVLTKEFEEAFAEVPCPLCGAAAETNCDPDCDCYLPA